MIRIRLSRKGKKKRPFYRIVVTNKRTRRDGLPIEEIGTYDPIKKDLKINKQKAEAWIAKGAQPTETVKNLLKK